MNRNGPSLIFLFCRLGRVVKLVKENTSKGVPDDYDKQIQKRLKNLSQSHINPGHGQL